jgi:hypothetical protein
MHCYKMEHKVQGIISFWENGGHEDVGTQPCYACTCFGPIQHTSVDTKQEKCTSLMCIHSARQENVENFQT